MSTVGKKITGHWKEILFGTAILFIFLTYTYTDFVVTQNHGILFWEVLSLGKVSEFYQYCIDHTSVPAVYDMTIYLIFAIWNLPCWIFQKITGLTAVNYDFCIFYGKTLILVGYYLAVKQFSLLYKSMRNASPSKERFLSDRSAAIYYASSFLFLCYTVYTGTYDVLELVFIFAGINALITNKRIRFLVFFSIAGSMKFFAIWIFIPLLLLKEKNILKILLSVLSCFIISFAENLIFQKTRILSLNEYARGFLAQSTINGVSRAGEISVFGLGAPVSLCIILYIFLCLYCFMYNNKEEFLFHKQIIFVSVVAWAILFFISGFNCYWIVLMVPFVTLMVTTDSNKLYINIILESFFSLSVFLNCQMRQWWVLGGDYDYATRGVLARILFEVFGLKVSYTRSIGETINRFFANSSADIIVYSIVIAVTISLLVINFPRKNERSLYTPEINNSLCLTVRNVLNILIGVIPSIYYVYQIIVINIRH